MRGGGDKNSAASLAAKEAMMMPTPPPGLFPPTASPQAIAVWQQLQALSAGGLFPQDASIAISEALRELSAANDMNNNNGCPLPPLTVEAAGAAQV